MNEVSSQGSASPGSSFGQDSKSEVAMAKSVLEAVLLFGVGISELVDGKLIFDWLFDGAVPKSSLAVEVVRAWLWLSFM